MDGRPNRRNKAASSNSSCVMWMLPDLELGGQGGGGGRS